MPKPVKSTLLAAVPETHREGIRKAILQGLSAYMKRNLGQITNEGKAPARDVIFNAVCGELSELGEWIIWQQEKGAKAQHIQNLEEELAQVKAQLAKCERELGAAIDLTMPTELGG